MNLINQLIIPNDVPTVSFDIKKPYIRAIQEVLDTEARSHGYDSILSAASYAGFPNDFQTEAIALATWRSEVWTAGYAILADVENNIIPTPTVQEVIDQLPTFSG